MKYILTLAIAYLFGLSACSTPEPQPTIDNQLQEIASSCLSDQLIHQRADYGTVIIMETATGEIKALANLTRQTDSTATDSQVNYATDWLYEPGFTFSRAVYLALLEDGILPEDSVDCENGKATIAGQMVVDDHFEGIIPLRRAVNINSNIICARMVHNQYGTNPEKFINRIKPLFPDIANVKQAQIPNNPNANTLVKMGFGYGLEVTPMHVLAFQNAIANGKYISPTLVTRKPEAGTAICSDAVLSELRQSMNAFYMFEREQSYFGDYGAKGSIATTQLPSENGEYVDEHAGRLYYASTVGYFPAKNPNYTVFIGLATKSYNYYGTSLAWPAFVRIANKIMENSEATAKGE